MTERLADIFLDNCLFDSEYSFRECRISDKILSRFTPENWNKIVSWIRSEKELFDYMKELPYSMAALVYATRESSEALNFILLLRDHPVDDNIVSFHGGSWGGPFITFRTGHQLLQALFRCGFKVRTSVRTDNRAAQRFVEALGMIKSTRKNNIIWYRCRATLFNKINLHKNEFNR